MRDDFFKNGYEIIKNIDKTSEALYQRKVEADGGGHHYDCRYSAF